ncbi:choice-of-anchor M domain-containing protein [Arcanobacterium hippocoleae]
MRKLGTAISAFALISCLAGTPAAFADTASHRPGKAGYGDIVPANLRVPAGSVGANPNAQPDAAGNVPHICAGKKLLHHSHVDAAYVTNLQGKLAVTVVDGQHVTEDPNSICVRLAPDADNAAGNEVSRIKVPNNSLYSFLGKPGTAVWNAPQEQIDNWRPVWAGVGAFDTAHEISLPENVLLNRVWLKMISNTGPGDVNVWRTEGFGGIVRGLTSQGDLEPLLLDLGSHGHWNWSFSESGVYRLGFQAGYELVKADPAEKTVTSVPSYVTWLVGSDTEVGLPAGTTTALNTIKTPTAASETIPNPADSPNPAAPPSDTEK